MMNLDKRQKVIVVLIVLALVVLVWQIYKIASSENAAPAATSAATSSTAPTKATSFPAASQAVHTNAVETAAMLSNAASNTTAAMDTTDAMGANQQKYLELVNEYQMSEIQRMIAEDQASIAQARYTAAEALSKITALSGGSANLSDLAGTSDQTNPADYELIYTGEDSGQWTATLKKNGQFNDVTAGSVLPDGANVLTVDDNGVLLQIGNKKELVTFNGVTPFDSNAEQIGNSTTANAPNLQNQIVKKPAVPQSGAQTTATTQTTLTTQTTATPQTAAAAPVTVQKAAVASPNKLVAGSTTPTLATPKINTGVSPAAVPVATSVPDFVPVKQPNLSAVNTAKGNTNAPAMLPSNVSQTAVSGYTIQLIADDSLSSVNNYITVNQLQNNAHALKTSRNGKSWYIVVYGSYPTAADAERALSTMPSDLHNQHPFIRKLSDVQSKTVS